MLDNIDETLDSFDLSSFNGSSWDTKIISRSKNRMKIVFKLDQKESEAFENFKNQTKPDKISEEQFVKSLFFLGLTTLETNLTQQVTKEIEKMQPQVEMPKDLDLSEFNTPGVVEDSEEINE